MTAYHCYVTFAGISKDGRVFIDLNEHSDPYIFYNRHVAPESVKKEMLAIALVAFTTGRLVQVELDDTAEYSVIQFLALELG